MEARGNAHQEKTTIPSKDHTGCLAPSTATDRAFAFPCAAPSVSSLATRPARSTTNLCRCCDRLVAMPAPSCAAIVDRWRNPQILCFLIGSRWQGLLLSTPFCDAGHQEEPSCQDESAVQVSESIVTALARLKSDRLPHNVPTVYARPRHCTNHDLRLDSDV